MVDDEEKHTGTIAASIAIGILVGLLFMAMMPGALLVAMSGGGGAAWMDLTTPDGIPVSTDGAFVWPLAEYGTTSVTSHFGPRRSPGGVGSTDHKGIDIGAPNGTEIHASADGIVVRSTYNRIRGYFVEIDHGNGISTLYQHMSVRLCEQGDVVLQGQVIGLVGSTGSSTGNHLHFEFRVKGTCYDPLQIFTKKKEDDTI